LHLLRHRTHGSGRRNELDDEEWRRKVSQDRLRRGEKEVRTWLIPPPCDGYLAPRQIKPVPPLLFLASWRRYPLHVVCRAVFSRLLCRQACTRIVTSVCAY